MKAKKAHAYTFVSQPGAKPFAIERAEGAYLIAPTGKQILDARTARRHPGTGDLDRSRARTEQTQAMSGTGSK